MSATRDKSQKITFVYSNLYSIYRKGVEQARQGGTQNADPASPSTAVQLAGELAGVRVPQAFESGIVIKARDLKGPAQPEAPVRPTPAAPKITAYTPAELLGKRLKTPSVVAAANAKAQSSAADPVASLKHNLNALNDLQARLRFMLKELEDLIRE